VTVVFSRSPQQKREMYRTAGRLLRERRLALGMTQEQVGRKVDLSRSSLANIEAGRQGILCHQLLQFFDILHADDAWRGAFFRALSAKDGRQRDYIRIFSKARKALG
jgi:transcriptional regulator with XRE-family HTH domain